ncbi:tRNA 2'-phosphotransferase 1 [Rhizina undulata]
MSEGSRGGGKRGGRGGGRGRRGDGNSDVLLSKALSRTLRHKAEEEGLAIRPDGFVEVSELLAMQKYKSHQLSFEKLKQLVESSDKQRFKLIHRSQLPPPGSSDSDPEDALAESISSDDPADHLIRATQGHSIQLESAALLTPLTAETAPPTILHGTFYGAYEAILSCNYLSRMSRNHIHFAADLPGESGVISGMRRDAQVLIFVDVKRAIQEGGLPFWISDNGVILTEGDGNGRLGLEWVLKIEDRKEGLGVLWEAGAVVTELPKKLRGKGVPRGKGHVRGGRGGRGERGRGRGARGGEGVGGVAVIEAGTE